MLIFYVTIYMTIFCRNLSVAVFPFWDNNDFLTGKVSLALLTSSFFGPFIAQSCLSALKRISIWLPGEHIDPAFGWP